MYYYIWAIDKFSPLFLEIEMVYQKFIKFVSYCYTLIFHQRMKLTILITQLEI